MSRTIISRLSWERLRPGVWGRTQPRGPLVALVCAGSCLLSVTRVLADPVSAVRGLANHVDVSYEPRLRSRADQSPTSTVLVRVSPVPDKPGTQRVEFIGTTVGNFDLREFLEREDGRAIGDLPAMPITVGSQLPADAGTDLFTSDSSWFSWAAHYRALMWTALALWAAFPIAFLAVRLMRKPAPILAAPPPVAPPTIEEELRAAITGASGSALSVDDRARLELLLFRYFGGHSGSEPATPDEFARVIERVRSNPDTRAFVVAVERWLHARGGESSRMEAEKALEELRRTRLAAPTTTLAPVAVGGAA